MKLDENGQTKPEVAVYYFPQYHPDARNDAWHGHGWTEWELVKTARPRFSGHRQPITPEWGYFNEADPNWTTREIDLAVRHGITCFIYDWYWFEDGPFLQEGLEKGFLGAPNCDRIKFAIMWANHDWLNIHPANFRNQPEPLALGRVSRMAFERIIDHLISSYFSRRNYLTLDGAPFFSVYELSTLIHGLGGLDATKQALDAFRAKVRAAGFPGLHLNAITWDVKIKPEELKNQLGFSSVGSYAWVHHSNPNADGFPVGSYVRAAERNYQYWEEARQKFPVPYYPNVSMGWDPSPRTIQSDAYESRGYPWTSVLRGNSPSAFRDALHHARAYAARNLDAKMITINAWNEWTEGSYLLPDTEHGNAYLEAIRGVFGDSIGIGSPDRTATVPVG